MQNKIKRNSLLSRKTPLYYTTTCRNSPYAKCLVGKKNLHWKPLNPLRQSSSKWVFDFVNFLWKKWRKFSTPTIIDEPTTRSNFSFTENPEIHQISRLTTHSRTYHQMRRRSQCQSNHLLQPEYNNAPLLRAFFSRKKNVYNWTWLQQCDQRYRFTVIVVFFFG